MNDQVDEVKSKTDIVSIIADRVELKKAGSNFKGLCPFHSEKTPSFMVSPELQIYKCFGCGKSGDVFSFLEEYEGMEFYESLKYLAEKTGVKLKPLKGFQSSLRDRLFDVNLNVSRFYQYILTRHTAGKRALEYITKDRGLTKSALEKFQIGFSPNVSFALQKYIVERKKFAVSELEQAGIIYMKGSQPVDRFRGRIIFPLFDHRGNVCGFAGRILPDSPNASEVAKYINTPETLIYKKSKVLYGLNETKGDIKKSSEAIVVEGELDLISSWQAGIKNAVAIKGSAFTEEQAKLLSRFTKSIIFSLDADFAGNEAARRGINIVQREGFEIRVARIIKYKDPDEAARKDPDAYKLALKNAVGVWDFIIDTVFEKYKGKTGLEKGKISKELAPVLASIEDKIVQAHYINIVSKRLDVPVEAVTGQVLSLANKRSETLSPKVSVAIATSAKTRREILEERLVATILRRQKKISKGKKFLRLITHPFLKKIFQEYLKYTKSHEFEISKFVGTLPAELREGFSDIILKEVEGIEDADDFQLAKETELVEKELKILGLKDRRSKLASDIRKFEDSDAKKELSLAQKKYDVLSEKLYKLEAKNIRGII